MNWTRSGVTLLVAVLASGLALANTLSGANYLTPHLAAGQSYSNVFSIMHAVKAEGYDEYVRRNGGSANYSVTEATEDSWKFNGEYTYDGQGSSNIGELRDSGRLACSEGKCERYTDGTGLVYNPALWGTPPKTLIAGMKWSVHIEEPWELGAAHGLETVTVIRVDPKTATATLMREGSSEGFFADEPQQLNMMVHGKTIMLDVTPGKAHWKGITTFTKGVVISDELVVERADVLRGADGRAIKALERRIMLLEAAPSPVQSL